MPEAGDVVSYTWPVLLDPPGAVDIGGNQYRIGNGPAITRTILTTVAHVSIYPDDTRYGPGASLYSDGTVRRPDLSIIEDLRLTGQKVSLGSFEGRTITTNDTPRRADGTPFTWGRDQALEAAGVPKQVAAAYSAGGVDILSSPIPLAGSTPLSYGPYRGLFPDNAGGTTLLDANGRVQVTGFDEVQYGKMYAPRFIGDDGIYYGAGTNGGASLQPSAASTSNLAAGDLKEPDYLGSSPSFDDSVLVPSTGGAPPVTPSLPPSLSGGGSGGGGAPITATTTAAPSAAAGAADGGKNEKLVWIGLAAVAFLLLSKKGG